MLKLYHQLSHFFCCPLFIANQLKRDKESDQLALFDPYDPFMGNK